MKNLMKPYAHFLTSALVVVLACSSGAAPPSPSPTDAGALPSDTSPALTDVTTPPADVVPVDVAPVDVAPVDADPGYPPEPYGPRVGDVIPNFTYQGYYAPMRTTGLSNEEEFGEVTLDMVRRSGARIAMIQIGAFW